MNIFPSNTRTTCQTKSLDKVCNTLICTFNVLAFGVRGSACIQCCAGTLWGAMDHKTSGMSTYIGSDLPFQVDKQTLLQFTTK